MSATQSNNLPLWVQDRDQVIAESTDVQWRYQTPPDYSRSKENLAKESTRNHLEGTLEAIVQNLVRTFEMEVSFKANPQQWLSIVNDKFRVSTNGGPEYQAEDLYAQGTYNLFMADSEHYKASQESFESSAKIFHTTFPQGFPWEVLEVYSGPPTVTFKWRHWGHFHGAYKDYAPTGETVEIIGLSVAHVTDDLKIISLEHYFDNTLFLDKLTAGGKQTNSETKGSGCPFGSWFNKSRKS
ncbi:pathogenesis related protein-like protein [Nostoc sp. NIES-3756]|uniref:SnoaL-like polyketide cyclase n=1 Tax=Nostoc sp. NIES-3756 TaxID=1751286 RepID=UPI000721E753|nr:SnoaL-like polyketide cyclase [Nostoc sp. NIES-3756]BAT55055.1 pathogenesis related protein-like protein [Nostoc sp. NIES-3756]BAY37162.1 pathogenesis related protein [Nostoc sp. NIES-2111]